MTSPEKLRSLRALMTSHEVTGYFIPKANPHQCEYLCPEEERLKWLTGFSGSAGCALVFQDKAYLFVDGRYRLQASQEVDRDCWEIIDTTFTSVAKWLRDCAPFECSLGYDASLLTVRELTLYQTNVTERQGHWQAIEENLIDSLWQDRPAASMTPIRVHPLTVAGVSCREKLQTLQQQLLQKGVDGVFLPTAESLNWLLNIRGGDLEHVPVVFGFGVVESPGQVHFFVDETKITPEVFASWQGQVTVHSLQSVWPFLETWGKQGKKLWMDPAEITVKAQHIFENAGGFRVSAENPTLLPKACKNPVELAGMGATHLRDGAALTTFLRWVDQESLACQATELSAAQKLHDLRAQHPTFQGESFPTISAVAAHGAIIHYRVTAETDLPFNPNDIYLVDSGAHYQDGSTDVTRTMVLGTPTSAQQDTFTRVLKGHIALARAIFPEGTTGSQLDVLARQFLWEQGEDYAHGTGHGVGSVLNIHEGPQRISQSPSSVPLQVGMILSNEPGYYEDNAYGIRIESLMVVEEKFLNKSTQKWLGFRILTLAPLDPKLMTISALRPSEIEWINEYQERVYESLKSQVDVLTQNWLREITRPFSLKF